MTHPIPPGTRDILPDEMRELRRLSLALVDAFERFGYGEVATPTIEYEEVLARGEAERGAPVAYRFFDESGELLAMRSDMTIPIARLVANRYATAEPPFRLCYLASAYRAIRPQRGQMREFTQAGVELIGRRAPEGTAEVVEVLAAALDAAGLTPRGDRARRRASSTARCSSELGVGERARAAILDCLARHDHVGLEAEVGGARPRGGRARDADRGAAAARRARGARARPRALRRDRPSARPRGSRRRFEALRARGVADRVQLDLGLLRDLGYYTGAILEVYDPALGHILGGGGRYDELMGRFGRPLRAAGFSLYLERLHVAQAEEERLEGGEPTP